MPLIAGRPDLILCCLCLRAVRREELNVPAGEPVPEDVCKPCAAAEALRSRP